MSEKRIVTVKCPHCSILLQVKTRSAEKVVGCPKCGASMTVSAAPVAAPPPPPFTFRVGEPSAPLPMAEPLTALPMAEPVNISPRWSPKHLAVAGGIGGTVLVAALLLIAFRPGAGQSNQPLPGLGGAAAQPGTNPETVQVSGREDDAAGAGEQTAVGAEQGGNFFDATSNAQIKEGANNPGNNFSQGGFPRGGGFPSVGNNQQRDWDLANGGRMGAMGLKKVQVPRR